MKSASNMIIGELMLKVSYTSQDVSGLHHYSNADIRIKRGLTSWKSMNSLE